MVAKLLGYRKGISKKTGKEYYSMNIVSPVSPFDTQGGYVGQEKAETVFISADMYNYLKPSDCGKDIEVQYGRFGIDNIEIL